MDLKKGAKYILSELWNWICHMFWTTLEPNVDTWFKAVIVTGCDTGFGNRLALRLNHLGLRVYATVLDAKSPGAIKLKEECKSDEHMIVVELDLTNEEQIASAKEWIIEDLNWYPDYVLWALVNNAGICELMGADWGTMDVYKKHMQIHAFGMVDFTRRLLPDIILAQGRVINVTSIAARQPMPYCAPYTMSKAAALAFNDVLRREMLTYGVKVISIEPFGFKSNMHDQVEAALKKNWQTSTERVKHLYGDNYVNKWIEYQTKQMIAEWRFTNLDLVVDDMVDAIMSRRPKRHYICSNTWKIKYALLTFFKFMPEGVIDWGLKFIAKNVVLDGTMTEFEICNA